MNSNIIILILSNIIIFTTFTLKKNEKSSIKRNQDWVLQNMWLIFQL